MEEALDEDTQAALDGIVGEYAFSEKDLATFAELVGGASALQLLPHAILVNMLIFCITKWVCAGGQHAGHGVGAAGGDWHHSCPIPHERGNGPATCPSPVN